MKNLRPLKKMKYYQYIIWKQSCITQILYLGTYYDLNLFSFNKASN